MTPTSSFTACLLGITEDNHLHYYVFYSGVQIPQSLYFWHPHISRNPTPTSTGGKDNQKKSQVITTSHRAKWIVVGQGDGQISDGEYTCLVTVVTVESERQSLCAKPPQMFLHELSGETADTFPHHSECCLVGLDNFLRGERVQLSQ
jgi:hypothetical protein